MLDQHNGNDITDKYTQKATFWGVDKTDPLIYLLQEFDARFEPLKRETEELKRQNEQWMNLTLQLLTLIKDQNTETKVLSQNTEKLSILWLPLSQAFHSCENQIKSQEPILKQLDLKVSSSSQQVSKLEASIRSLENLPSKLNQKVQSLSDELSNSIRNSNGKQRLALWAIGFLSTVSLMQGLLLIQMNHSLDSLNANVNSALIRLKRLEER